MRIVASGVLFVVLTVLRTVDAHAQAAGYIVAGGATESGRFWVRSLAGGVESPARGPLSISAEAGYLASGDVLVWVLSANGVVHVRSAARQPTVSPFVGAGYTLIGSGFSGLNAWNLNGGVDLRFKPQAALRLEARTYVLPYGGSSYAFWALRAGIVFTRHR